MKRSEINLELRAAEKIFRKHHFHLPPFAFWSLSQWSREKEQVREILDCYLGWDITDFGRGNFRDQGLLLFTLRNGAARDPAYPKPYAEKIMIVRESQLTLMHCHRNKTEDIINRSGGDLCFKLYRGDGKFSLAENEPVVLSVDGTSRHIPAGGNIILKPGESITLEPGIFHSFYGVKGSGDVLVGEVSSVNDDHCDNIFHEPQSRFPEIEEDEIPYRLLARDYEHILTGNVNNKNWKLANGTS